MNKFYEAPELFVDEYVADTMIASTGLGNPKNGTAGNNQNCHGCDTHAGQLNSDGTDTCTYYIYDYDDEGNWFKVTYGGYAGRCD